MMWRLALCVLAILGLILLCLTWSPWLPSTTLTTSAVSLTAALACLLFGLRGPSRVTALAAKIVITASALMLVAQLLTTTLPLLSTDTVVRTFTLISGLLLAKANPHQTLYPWMYVMIATKIELVLIGIVISIPTAGTTVINPLLWWVIIPLMLLSAVSLALHFQAAYRTLIIFTALYSVLLVSYSLSLHTLGVQTFAVVSVALWPIITTRLIGYHSFHTKS